MRPKLSRIATGAYTVIAAVGFLILTEQPALAANGLDTVLPQAEVTEEKSDEGIGDAHQTDLPDAGASGDISGEALDVISVDVIDAALGVPPDDAFEKALGAVADSSADVLEDISPPLAETGSLNGIDISHHQPAHVAGLVPADFVIIKASEGVGWRDPSFAVAYSHAKEAERLIGAYHFSRADLANSPEEEADWFLSVVGDRVGEALLILDHETKSQAVGGADWALRFLDRIYEVTKVKPLIYGSRKNMCQPSYEQVAEKYQLWVAHYRSNLETGYQLEAEFGDCPPWSEPTLYQYAELGRLAGYENNLDVNIFYGDPTDWVSLARGDIAPPADSANWVVLDLRSADQNVVVGESVTQLQELLLAAGYDVSVDGHAGGQTKAALIAYQAFQGLEADAIAGAETWNYLASQ